MANLREIQRRMSSIKSTMQITRTMEMLKQQRFSALHVCDQVISIFAAKEDFLDDIDLDHVTLFRDELAKYMTGHCPKLRAAVLAGKLDDVTSRKLRARIARFKKSFLAEHPNKRSREDVEKSAEPTVTAPPEGGHVPLEGQE